MFPDIGTEEKKMYEFKAVDQDLCFSSMEKFFSSYTALIVYTNCTIPAQIF